MARNFLGLVVGVLAGMLVVMLVEQAGHIVLRIPGIVDTSSPQALAQEIQNMPFGLKLSVIVAWTLGAFVGSSLAIWIARGSARTGWIAVVVLWLSGIVTLFTFPHPPWMEVTGVILPLMAGWLAQRIFGRIPLG